MIMDPATLCLAITIFFEAGGEPEPGKFAVAEVVVNRVKSHLFPNSVCRVVKQRNQFSFTLKDDFKWIPPKIKNKLDRASWNKSVQIAELTLKQPSTVTKGSTHFYAPKAVKRAPKWVRRKNFVIEIGGHRFYKEK